MKKLLFFVLSLVVLLSGCDSSVVDLDTPKSKELTAQYNFYADSMNTLRAGIGVTPEQADEIFIVLVSCGLNEKVASVTKSGDGFKVRGGYVTYDVQLADGAVSSVLNGSEQLYPAPELSEAADPPADVAAEAETLEQAVDSAISSARAEKITSILSITPGPPPKVI